MNSERVTPKNAAKELQMDVITLRELMKREKLPIGYAIKREGKSKWGFYIYRHLLDQEKERLPKQICPDEDNTTPRICVAPNILSAIQAMPQGGTVAYNMARIGVPVVIHAYYIESDAILMPEQIADKVPDAVATGEMWVMAVPAAVRRIDYEIVDPYVPMRIDRNGTEN